MRSFRFLALLLCAGCSDIRLEPPAEELAQATVNDLVTLHGSFCASPAATVQYPVKVLFLVDGSGSQQFTDQNRQRVVAVEETINALIGEGNTYFKIVVFNASVTSTPPASGSPPPPVFTNQLSALLPGLTNLAEADTLTDYQGALAFTYSELLRDMSESDPLELTRTKYVIIFISDGMPDPQCTAGLNNDFDPNFAGGVNLLCEDQAFLNCLLEVPASVAPPGATCDFGQSAPCDDSCSSNICNFDGTACYRSPDASTLFGGLNNVELAAGLDYNQPYQILQKVREIMDLGERFDVGELSLHAGLVLDPLADPAIIDIFGDAGQAAPLMQEVAALGNGQYLEFYGGDSIDFLQLDFDPIKQQRSVTGFFADNHAARPELRTAAVDTDFDGLADDEELADGTNPFTADSDGDGYGDLLEQRLAAFSFDANDACLPALVDVPGANPTAPCDPAAPVNCEFQLVAGPGGSAVRGYVDTDRDGLHDCEERALGTYIDNPDSDGDAIPDATEVRYGLDPLAWDATGDADFDSIPNANEIEAHLPPLLPQQERDARERYRYKLTESGETLDGAPCYDFVVSGVHLMPTRRSADLNLGVGYNDIYLHIVEHVGGILGGVPLLRTACVRTRYVPPSLKIPANGEITLTEPDFRYAESQDPLVATLAPDQLFDPAADCVEVP